jgi:hypothetical protein
VAAILPALLLAAAGLTRVGAQPPGPAPSHPGELSGKKFKNIKVLKTLPADRLIPVMHDWSTSLGVKCDFCHVVTAEHTGFERDDKPTKNVARQMVTMVNDMNRREKPLDNRATCYMCHHGRPEPEFRPGTEAPGGRTPPGR